MITRSQRLLLLDVDGTIVDHGGDLVPGCDRLVDWCVRSEVQVGLCSARPVGSLKALAGKLPGVKYIAALQGAVALHDASASGELPDWVTLREQTIQQSTVLELTARLSEYSVWWYTSDCWLIDSVSPEAKREASIVGSTWDGLISDRLDEPVAKILVLDTCTPSHLSGRIDSWKLPVSCSESNPGYVEVVSSLVASDKGSLVLREAAERESGCIGVRVIAVGDGINDLGLLRSAWMGFTFADAPSDVRHAANGVLSAERTTAMRELLDLVRDDSVNWSCCYSSTCQR